MGKLDGRWEKGDRRRGTGERETGERGWEKGDRNIFYIYNRQYIFSQDFFIVFICMNTLYNVLVSSFGVNLSIYYISLGEKTDFRRCLYRPLGTAHAYFKVRVLFKQMQRTLFMAIGDVIIYQNDQEEILYKNLELKIGFNNFLVLLFIFFCTKPGKVKKNYIVNFQTARRE